MYIPYMIVMVTQWVQWKNTPAPWLEVGRERDCVNCTPLVPSGVPPPVGGGCPGFKRSDMLPLLQALALLAASESE